VLLIFQLWSFRTVRVMLINDMFKYVLTIKKNTIVTEWRIYNSYTILRYINKGGLFLANLVYADLI